MKPGGSLAFMVLSPRTPGGKMDNAGSIPTQETEPTDAELLHELISQRAYLIYEARGCVDGFHEQDWLQAEREILGEDEEPQKAAAVSG
jgi:hypothetical protein